MRRIVWFVIAVLILSTVSSAEAAGKKKGKKKKKAATSECRMVGNCATGPFADVPKGHWAYEAVAKAVEAGVLQGWENKYHGTKVVNRYQMAVIVARMLDRVGVLRAGGKVITPEDVANLEALTIEFADELALLNVKVNKLEDSIAAMRKDLDLVKAEMASGGVKAGISGSMSGRFAFTDNGGPNWRGGVYTGAPNAVLLGHPLQTAPYPGATTPLTRYRGAAVSGVGNAAAAQGAYQYSNRNFFTVSNFAINVDRQFDPKVHFHAQMNVNVEGYIDNTHGAWGTITGYAPTNPGVAGITSLPMASGRGDHFAFANPFGGGGGSTDLMMNEAYVVFDDWFTENVNTRLGVFALPMNTEVNGPSRTYQWTITPSVANTKWESLRPVGLDVFRHNDKDELMFYVGFFTPHDMTLGVPRSGALLSAPTGFSAVPVSQRVAANATIVQLDPQNNPGSPVAGLWGLGRFPTPLGFSAMTDAPFGSQTASWYSSDDIGFYGMIGTHSIQKPDHRYDWHLAYYDRNGDIRATSADHLSLTDWYAWQAHAAYQWEKVYGSLNYYEGHSSNYSLADFNDPLVTNRYLNSTPFANAAGADTVSRSFMALVNWQFNKRGSVTGRYEYAEDKTGLAQIKADIWTLAFGYRTSDHGWLQLEWISPNSTTVSENGWRNSSDVADDLVQLNYKLNW